MTRAQQLPLVTAETVVRRFAELVDTYRQALPGLGYSSEDCERLAMCLREQLSNRTYRDAKNPRPIWHLVTGKRVTRFHIRSAIEQRPAARAARERMRDEYLRRCKAIRAEQPHACFMSFETVYASKLRPDFTPFKALFRLTPKSAESVFA